MYGGGTWNEPDTHLSNMATFVSGYGYKPLFMTEYVHLNDIPSFDDGWKLAWHVYNALYHLNVSSYYYWTLFRNGAGGMVGVQSTTDYEPRDVYRFFKAYTHFTDPNWYLLDTSVSGYGSDNLRMSAFKNPTNDELTVVILNKSSTSESITLDLSGCTATGSEVYRSSETEDWEYTGTFSNPVTLPEYSITTIAFDVTPD
jgi:O-glycosyl hydrolase